MKSTWPGVSIRLIVWSSHLTLVAALVIVMPRSLLQVHVVHGGAVAAAADVLDLVDAAGVEQDPLAERGLARVDVGRDADVAKLFKVHGSILCLVYKLISTDHHCWELTHTLSVERARREAGRDHPSHERTAVAMAISRQAAGLRYSTFFIGWVSKANWSARGLRTGLQRRRPVAMQLLKTVGELCIVIGFVGEARPISLIYDAWRQFDGPKIGRKLPYLAAFPPARRDRTRQPRPTRTDIRSWPRILDDSISDDKSSQRPAPPMANGSPADIAGRPDLLARHPWLTFLLPFIVYMVVGSFEPAPPKPADDCLPDGSPRPVAERQLVRPRVPALSDRLHREDRAHDRRDAVRAARLSAVSVPHLAAGDRRRRRRRRALDLALPAAAWNASCSTPLGLDKFLRPGRAAGVQSARTTGRHAGVGVHILAIRFLGLALVVPIIEEFFLRGFMMRFVVRDDWWKVPFGEVTPRGHRRRHAGSHADAPGRATGRRRLVQPGDLADDPHPQHLGLRRRPRGDEFAAGHLRRHAAPVAVVVTSK